MLTLGTPTSENMKNLFLEQIAIHKNIGKISDVLN